MSRTAQGAFPVHGQLLPLTDCGGPDQRTLSRLAGVLGRRAADRNGPSDCHPGPAGNGHRTPRHVEIGGRLSGPGLRLGGNRLRRRERGVPGVAGPRQATSRELSGPGRHPGHRGRTISHLSPSAGRDLREAYRRSSAEPGNAQPHSQPAAG